MQPTFFSTPAAFRRWLARNHARKDELLVGYWKKHTGEASISWPESVDEALCFGWIDGIRRRIDERAYCIRFTPRRRGSTWSKVNVARAKELIRQGRMEPAGRAAFEAREEAGGSYEQREAELRDPYREQLRQDGKAWAFLQEQPPHYRRTVGWWVMSAKREETRQRRLEQLRECSARGEWIPQFLGRGPSRAS